MSTTHRVRKAAAVALLCATAAVGQSVANSEVAVAQATSTLGSGGEYHPLTPTRIFETRGTGINDVAPLGKKPTSPTGSTFSVDVLGQGGIPAEVAGANRDVLAVVVNVTVIDPTGSGYLSISPKGAAIGQSSLINFGVIENVPNLAVVGAGADGGVTVSLVTPGGAGAANVAIDVFGWIAKTDYPDATDSGARFVPVGPGRILDTRSVPVPAGWPSGQALGADGRLALPIRGADAVSPNIADLVPNNPNITGVMVNITAVNTQGGSQDTFVSATPNPIPAGSQPGTSNTNLRRGQNKANMAIVPIGADGSIHLYNAAGATHLIIDVLGYLVSGMPANTTTGRVVPLDSPFRVFDTRLAEFGSAPLGLNAAESWSFKAFADSVTLGGVPLGSQSAVLGNLTGTGLSRIDPRVAVTTYMTMYPGGAATKPESSNINVAEGQAVPNMSLLRYGPSGTDPNVIQAYNFDGSIHYLLDVYAVVLS